MNSVNVQWLTQDRDLFEVDWLSYLLSDVADGIRIHYNVEDLDNTENTILICSHAVPYRYFLDNLRKKGKKYGIILLSDENLVDPCEWLHDPACLFCFRNYVNPMFLNHPKVNFFGLGYKRNFNNKKADKKLDKREYVWSFAGTPHGERKKALEIFSDVTPNKTHSCSGFCAEDSLSTEQYAELMRKTQFGLCPVGQDSCDSFRLYEALEAGCIPVTQSTAANIQFEPSYWHAIFRGETDFPFVISKSWEEAKAKTMAIVQKGELNATQDQCKAFWDKWKNTWKRRLESESQKLNEKA